MAIKQTKNYFLQVYQEIQYNHIMMFAYIQQRAVNHKQHYFSTDSPYHRKSWHYILLYQQQKR